MDSFNFASATVALSWDFCGLILRRGLRECAEWTGTRGKAALAVAPAHLRLRTGHIANRIPRRAHAEVALSRTASDRLEGPSGGSLEWMSPNVSEPRHCHLRRGHITNRRVWSAQAEGAQFPTASDSVLKQFSPNASRIEHVALSTPGTGRNISEGRYGGSARRFPALLSRDYP